MYFWKRLRLKRKSAADQIAWLRAELHDAQLDEDPKRRLQRFHDCTRLPRDVMENASAAHGEQLTVFQTEAIRVYSKEEMLQGG